MQDDYIEKFKIKYKEELAAAEEHLEFAPGPKVFEDDKPRVPPSTFNSSFHDPNETYIENDLLIG